MPRLSTRERKIQKSLDILEIWLEKRYWKLVFDTCGYSFMDKDEKIISVNARQKKEIQLYDLIHEIGHLLIHGSKRDYKHYHPVQFLADKNHKNKNLARSKRYKLDVVEEELKAWARGKKLAERLGVFIDQEIFIKNRCAKVFTYVDWAANE